MKLCDTCIYGGKSEYEKPCIICKDDCVFYKKENRMNEGKIAIVTTNNCSRFFKGDRIRLIRYINANNKYLAKRVEGFIEGEIGEEDFEIESNSKR